MRITFESISDITYRELIWMYDSYLLTSWDHTAVLAQSLDNILCCIGSLAGAKNSIKPVENFHPYRADNIPKSNVTADNIEKLKKFGDMVLNKNRK